MDQALRGCPTDNVPDFARVTGWLADNQPPTSRRR